MKRPRSGKLGTQAGLVAVLVAAAGLPAAAQQADVAAGISSSLVTRGIVLGRREPSLQGSAAYYAANGFYAGISGATLRFASERDRAVQVTVKAGWLAPLSSDWMATLSLQHVAYPFDPDWNGFSYTEASAGLAYADLLALSVSQLRHPGGYAAMGRTSRAVDLVGRLPLRPGIALAAGIGYYDLDARYGYGYAYGNLGIGLRLGRASLDLAYTLTDATAKAHFGPAAADHWTASLFWHF